MARKIKKPGVNQGKRVAVSPDTPDYNKQSPVFSLEFLQKPYCISDCNRDQKASILDSIHSRCQVPWSELINSGRHKLGTEKIRAGDIKAAIPQRFAEETYFLAFRAIGMAPAVGVRIGRTFYVLWIDHDFSLYNHGK